ncbi:ABC transporter permease subunit [Bordetella avium]|uniref:ABC tranpsorter, ATP binding/permease protein n=1 Tax=Bordetella avium (strain 197N) TaxID=360910 RepID=Q2L311_BORA1|nr:branched-chain amino acid ABC transporter ATP-binding protein/permease [Bordetella avium]RIQ54567.1 ATP-binding cassette domain-containing protein [Bordetella avium]CAJ48878.1 ABC tranpsorter, ATP binding/permease protein [Bordetella avium 197N]
MNTESLSRRAAGRSKNGIWIMMALTVIGLALVNQLPTYYVGLLAMVGINALVCIGLSFVLGTGQVSLGHAAFVGIGAYSCAILSRDFGVPTLLTIPISVALCMAVAYFLGRITLRLKGHSLPLATLAWGMAIYVCFVAAINITGGASGFSDIPPLNAFGLTLDTRGITIVAWVLVALTYLAYRRIYRGRVGRIAKAIKGQSTMATAFGADVPAVKMKVFVMSAALAALAGCLYAYYMRFLSPTSFTIGASFNYLIMVVLGGVAHPVGAILGAVTFMLMELGAQYLFAKVLGVPGQMETMLFGVILILMLLRWPDGLLTWIKPRNRGRDAPEDKEAQLPQLADVRPLIERIDVDNVTKRFGGLQALKGVSISVLRNRITGLIGPNGAGKSTLFNAVTAVAPATTGEVRIDGKPLPPQARDVIRTGMARTFQHVKLVPELTVLQNVMIGGYVDGRAGLVSSALGLDRKEEAVMAQRARVALEQVGLLETAQRPIGSLPLGSQRMVEVARALMSRPDVLLLDEPAAGLRAGEKAQLVTLLKSLRNKRHMAILLVEHDMELVMGCVDHIFVLNHGTLLAQGNREEVQSNPAVISAYLGAES